MSDLAELLDSNDGIDGGNAAGKYWFIGLEYGERYENDTDKKWWKWPKDKYYSKIMCILKEIGVDYKDAFLANLYPIRKQNVSKPIDGFVDVDDYYAFCDLHGRRVIKDGLAMGAKKIIVCIGMANLRNFLLQLADGHRAEYVTTNCNPNLVEIKFANHPHIDRLIVVHHISRKGITYCEAVGNYIRKINSAD